MVRAASTAETLGASALLGAATGLRSQMGLVAVLLGTGRTALPTMLRRRGVRSVATTFALGELVVDKLPSTSARTGLPGLIPRLGLGALSSAVLAWSRGRSVWVPAAIGSGAAALSAFGGLSARTTLSRRLPPLTVALGEDLLAGTVATVAVRLGGATTS